MHPQQQTTSSPVLAASSFEKGTAIHASADSCAKTLGPDTYRLAFERAVVPAALIDLNRRCLAANGALCSLLGYGVAQLVGTRLRRITYPGDVNVDRSLFRQLLDGSRRDFAVEKRYVHADGREIRAETVVALVRDAGGNPTCFTLQLHDITDRCASEKSLRLAALADDLTGLYNRRGFRMVAEHEIRHAARNGNSILVLYIDIDDFKEINDRYGHATGDKALQSVADLLRATLRESDLVGRQGGDEFVALLRCGQDESEATITLRLRRRLRWYNATRMLPFELRLSIGAVRVDAGDRRSIDELLNVADAVLYEAKRDTKRETKRDAVSHVHRDDRSPV